MVASGSVWEMEFLRSLILEWKKVRIWLEDILEVMGR